MSLNILFLEFILASSFLLIISTVLQFYLESKLPGLTKDLDKVVFLAKLGALLSLIKLLSSDKISDILEGTMIAGPLNIKIEELKNYISANWDSLKGYISILNEKIKDVDRIIFLSKEVSVTMSHIVNENKISLVLLFCSSLFLLLNFVGIAFLFSGLAFGILAIAIASSLNCVKYVDELKDFFSKYA
ncbi:hypothetical protein SULI_03970 [Saccharolobus solfataricus]|uniref:Uncharacterized protein n=3 Tax=Saccharolobus solfataricus TaxID=2287 RepID=Q97UL3_SACS2|nr:hypothetical protein [Saccharolobus solfataricus]AAK43096.1 Hypothetical protein SSO2991 [Saccharolobus solfataricus P2]AKA73149.1 hypothetical protein SULB_0778 [Saccharolobus solfataricus]AKA75847.1 hypothetical protein SULC_0776 [Saccharolobus solfataricus]AKA78539.1 hypothetical protein SULA_0776 [Saccharolobus solfataricus]AZF67651.1 hypothetical protein SULG_03970 [Saccharolobus solfataricus]